AMEDIHGVDVSWLQHSNKDHLRNHAPSAPAAVKQPSPPPSSNGTKPDDHESAPAPQQPAPQKRDPPQQERKTSPPPPPEDDGSGTPSKPLQKRPSLLGRTSSEKSSGVSPDGKTLSRKGSWISSISAKFGSSQAAPANGAGTNGQAQKAQNNGGAGGLPIANPFSPGMGQPTAQAGQNGQAQDDLEPYVPQPPKGSTPSFISSALRRLSSGGPSPNHKVTPNGGVCPRRVLNVDPYRERCLVPELSNAKLRRVAFCVDVEIAGNPRYRDDEDSPERRKRSKDISKKLKEAGEGEALKHPEAVAEEKEKTGVVQVSSEDVGTVEAPNPEGTVLEEEKKEPTSNKKKEKKKRSEAERKERKEKKRRKAEENGSVPLEFTNENDATPSASGESTPKKKAPQDRPTTDPLRIYRRCCQLRETPILKRISEQLAEASNCPVVTPGVVSCLNLTGSRLTLADMNTLGDWLAVVPVKKILLEDADLTDEGVRVILAGLLAAKTPEYKRKRPQSPISDGTTIAQERSGVVEKLVLKRNPKITREGWKHISLFIYMCRSLKAIDVSHIPLPKPRQPPKQHPGQQNNKHQPKVPLEDIGEILCKSISERLGGSQLEELLMTDCSLNAQYIRKIIDGAIMCGIQRLGLSSNDIDEEGLEHVVRYIRSGVCLGLDLGGNNLRDRVERLCEGITDHSPLWALSLADCNLSPGNLKPLLPRLTPLQNFRFIDLSHNRELFSTDPSALAIIRKYMPQLKFLKRIHLEDVAMSPAQAIGLAEVLPECPQLAHLNILENPELSALASAEDESSQEEACALYASLMAAVRVSDSIICIDVDVPSQETSEVVKALAKQVVAYCLRNMERFTAQEAVDTANAIAMSQSTAGSDKSDVQIPEVLLHIVGHGEESSEAESEDLAPDDDYIVGGTGLVKALNYCLLEKASDNLRRKSMPGSGANTPTRRFGSMDKKGEAKTMSKNLLGSARKIRARLQPALAREARAGDEMAYRRLLFLDQTLQGIIQRFEDEYPECRIPQPAQLPPQPPSTDPNNPNPNILSTSIDSLASTLSNAPHLQPAPSTTAPSSTNPTDPNPANTYDISDDDTSAGPHLTLRSRHNSDVSLASRAQTLEEGRIHRLGQSVRREILRPQTADYLHGTTGMEGPEPRHLEVLREQLFRLSGEELREMVVRDGWEETVKRIGASAEELRGVVGD
ncbi:RNI-like protein, partial [Saccharata proteae CBS 121410]